MFSVSCEKEIEMVLCWEAMTGLEGGVSVQLERIDFPLKPSLHSFINSFSPKANCGGGKKKVSFKWLHTRSYSTSNHIHNRDPLSMEEVVKGSLLVSWVKGVSQLKIDLANSSSAVG